MEPTNKKLIAVVGATGQQGGAVVRALHAGSQFKVRALTRDPAKHRELADEVIQADLNRPETLRAAFEGAHGVFLVTNFWGEGSGEVEQATAAIRAAKDAGVKHFVWSTLPDVEGISGGKLHVPHFTGKAKVDRVVKKAGFPNYSSSSRLSTIRTLSAFLLRKSWQTDSWAGFSRLIQLCGAFTWAISRNLVTSWPEHSRTPIRPAMVSICP
jgi:NAD(P)-dependent dehydrogenase (short-subunit alcohol dehydrogenase family)